MKVMLLADANSVHTLRWANALSARGVRVRIFSLTADSGFIGSYSTDITIVTLHKNVQYCEGGLSKLSYLRSLPIILRTIRDFQPDIVHAHYATSYGLLGALSFFRPFVLSVWGSDVYSFPRRSLLHKTLIKFNFWRADRLLSTSRSMAEEVALYCKKDVLITPFGIDLSFFRPIDQSGSGFKDSVVVGTIKSLEPCYGIEYLIRAFSILRERNKSLPLKLLIVGGGSLESQLRHLVAQLGVANYTIFTGPIPHSEVVKYYNMMTVPVFVSLAESFGVAAIEAGACEKAVVVSRVGGLPEVVVDQTTGLVVDVQDPMDTALAIERLILNDTERLRMGRSARAWIADNYEWNDNVQTMLNIYLGLIH